MTMVRGVRVLATPCCGAHYAEPRYLTMNFSALEYWTDGWREQTPMPNDVGLRQCDCGQFYLLSETTLVEITESSDCLFTARVDPEPLPECVTKADTVEMETAARLAYWRHLNHPYREKYRLHRDAEEAATQAAWKAAHPDRRT